MQKIFLSSSEETGPIKLFPEDVSEGIIKNWGYIVYRKLWEELEIDKFLKQYISQNSRIKFDIDKVAFLMTVQRLIQPVSKLQTYYRKNRYFGFEEDIDLNQLYRGLDILAQIKEDLELYLYHKNRDLFNMVVDVVFYDVTTFYFESIKQDDLRDFGFSKDNKVNEVQVVMGMLVDKEGRPVGYELFPGDIVDSKTMIEILRKLKEKFCIDQVIIVADKGLNSKLNLKLIKEEVLNAYHDLWKIEQSFRVMKSCLEVRPIFHWTEKRIRGHFVVCYLAFLLERTLEYSLRSKGKELSSDRIKEAIGSMNFVEIEINGKKYLIKQKIEEEAEDILKVMKIKAPKNFITYEEGMELISMRK
ncbi:MAG: hypothetical protein PWP75_809 [Caldanaerobacter sp.]|nr:hypothetical protein [Caldanaerobacter sp.]